MGKSVWDLIQESIEKYDTRNNTYEMFSVGNRVKVVTPAQDFNFFFNEPTGVVVRNSGKYLGIIVEWDEPRHFEGGHIEKEFNFIPSDLVKLG